MNRIHASFRLPQVTVFEQPGYLENFVQAIFDTNPELKGQTLVLGGDGRYLNDKASLTILRMAAANGIRRVITMPNFLASTPAISHLIRSHQAKGAIILTASHNPGGAENDFGIKFNTENGGPAPTHITDKIYEQTTKIKNYCIFEGGLVESVFMSPGETTVGRSHSLHVRLTASCCTVRGVIWILSSSLRRKNHRIS